MGILQIDVIDDHGGVSHGQGIRVTIGAVGVSGRGIGIDVTRVDDVVVVVWPVVGSVVEVSEEHDGLTGISNLAGHPLQELNGLVVVGHVLEGEDREVSWEEMGAEDVSYSNRGVQATIEGSGHRDGRVAKV